MAENTKQETSSDRINLQDFLETIASAFFEGHEPVDPKAMRAMQKIVNGSGYLILNWREGARAVMAVEESIPSDAEILEMVTDSTNPKRLKEESKPHIRAIARFERYLCTLLEAFLRTAHDRTCPDCGEPRPEHECAAFEHSFMFGAFIDMMMGADKETREQTLYLLDPRRSGPTPLEPYESRFLCQFVDSLATMFKSYEEHKAVAAAAESRKF